MLYASWLVVWIHIWRANTIGQCMCLPERVFEAADPMNDIHTSPFSVCAFICLYALLILTYRRVTHSQKVHMAHTDWKDHRIHEPFRKLYWHIPVYSLPLHCPQPTIVCDVYGVSRPATISNTFCQRPDPDPVQSPPHQSHHFTHFVRVAEGIRIKNMRFPVCARYLLICSFIKKEREKNKNDHDMSKLVNGISD